MTRLRTPSIAACLAGLGACTLSLPFDSLSSDPSRAPRPSSHYKLDELQGSSADDSVGGRTAVLDGDEKVPKFDPTGGRRGGALVFEDDGWLTVPALSADKFPPQGTVALWLRLRVLPDPTDGTDVFGTWEEDADADAGAEEDDFAPLHVYIGDRGTITFDRTVGEQTRTSVSTPISVGAWVLVAAAWDIPRNRATLYVRQDGQRAQPLSTGDLPAGFVVRAPYFTFTMYQGSIDDIRFYDRMLEPTEYELID